MTNGDLYELGESISERVATNWPTIKSAMKPYEDEGWFVILNRMVEEYREYV
tara:strand:- start:3830 stop:3985 length:156 start_codon:yes stop_codon:yes gene_type:complete